MIEGYWLYVLLMTNINLVKKMLISILIIILDNYKYDKCIQIDIDFDPLDGKYMRSNSYYI